MRLMILLLCSSFVSAPAMDPPLPKGRILTSFTYRILEGNRYYDFLEDEIPIAIAGELADYEHESIVAELIYGWTNDMAVVFRTEHLDRSLTTYGTLSNSGVSGYYLGLRQRIGPAYSGVRLMAETGVRFNDQGSEVLPLGSDGIDWYAIGSYNQDFARGNTLELDVGYRFRGDEPADEIFVNAGLTFNLGGLVDVGLHYQTFDSQEEKKTAYDFTTYAPEQALQGFSVELERDLGPRWSVTLAYHDDVAGRNTFATDGASLSISWLR